MPGGTVNGEQRMWGSRSNRSPILAEGLTKSYGEVRALRGIDLEVSRGTTLGLLGPNGAGKTTAVRILTTLIRPDGGHAEVAGFDVVRDAKELRKHIGLTGQNTALDDHLTGREQLQVVGSLYHIGRRESARRAEELLERFDLVAAAGRTVKTYSGGMKRRLDLAASLIGRPEVLFLDEPTTGLDPRSRLGMWEVIERLVSEGTTLLLTTQYLEEADKLARDIAVVDQGLVIARGTPDELKSMIGSEVLELSVRDPAMLDAAAGRLASIASVGAPKIDYADRTISLTLHGGSHLVSRIVRALGDDDSLLEGMRVHQPTLDEVFLTLTGHAAEVAEDDSDDGDAGSAAGSGSRRRRRWAGGGGPAADGGWPSSGTGADGGARPPGGDGNGAAEPGGGSGAGEAHGSAGGLGDREVQARTGESPDPEQRRRPPVEFRTGAAVAELGSDILTILRRNLLRYVRIPTLLVWNTIQPVMFVLMFVYVFGGVIKLVVHMPYIDFLMPGIFIQSAVFGSTQAAVGLSEDLDKGIVDRFRSLPMARVAVLAGRTFADAVRTTLVVLLMTFVAAILGFRFHNGPSMFICGLLVVVAFGYSFSWFSAVIGLQARDPEAAQAATFVWTLPVTFASSAFVPVSTMPGWMQVFAKANPVSLSVDAVRNMLVGGGIRVPLVETVAWMAGLLLFSIPLSVVLYRRSA